MRVTRSAVPDRTGQQAFELSRCDRAFGVWNRIAVRVVGRVSEHVVDALDEALGNHMFELFGFVVHFSPAHAHHLDEKELDQAMPAQDEPRELFDRLWSAAHRCTARTRQAPTPPAPSPSSSPYQASRPRPTPPAPSEQGVRRWPAPPGHGRSPSNSSRRCSTEASSDIIQRKGAVSESAAQSHALDKSVAGRMHRNA